MNKRSPTFWILGCLFFMCSVTASAKDDTMPKTPFDSYFRVADKFYVYDQSLISPYIGPDVSHWNLLIPHEAQALHDAELKFYDRKRLGVVTLSPTLKVYVDVMGDYMTEYYEFRDIKNGNLIHKFAYYGLLNGALLVNGQGAIYQYHRPKDMCFGNETKKFLVKKDKLVEVRQPFAYWENTETTSAEDITLFLQRSESSQQVATLTKGTPVKVLALEEDWFLIATPLGLTGWIPMAVKRPWGEGKQKTLTDMPTLEKTLCN